MLLGPNSIHRTGLFVIHFVLQVCNDVMLDPLTQQAPLLRNLQSSNQLIEKEQRHQLEQEINFKNYVVQEKVMYWFQLVY